MTDDGTWLFIERAPVEVRQAGSSTIMINLAARWANEDLLRHAARFSTPLLVEGFLGWSFIVRSPSIWRNLAAHAPRYWQRRRCFHARKERRR